MLVHVLFILLFIVATPSNAQIIDNRLLQPSPAEQWLSLTTEHFEIHFVEKHKSYAQRLAEIAEIQATKLHEIMLWTPKGKTQIVVNDSVDFSNGASTVYPYNQFFVYMNEPTAGALKDQIDFVETLFTHEYTHILQIDQVAGIPKIIRTLFGKSPSVIFGVMGVPQVFAPHWVSEGIAVHNESSSGYGRGNSALFKAQMRQEVIKGLASFSDESYEGYYAYRWPFGQVYLYGAYFYKFMQERYGDAVLSKYITSYSDNLIPWRMNNRARQATGKSAVALWSEYQQYLRDLFEPEIQRIKDNGVTPRQTMYSDQWQNRLLTPGPNESIFFYHQDQKHPGKILQLFPDGQTKHILSIDGLTSLQWHTTQGLLLSKPDVCENIHLYSDLYQFELKERTLRRLTDCARISRADWLPDGNSIVGVQTSSGQNALVSVNLQGKVQELSKLKLGESIGQPDISPIDEKLVAAVKREGQGWNIETFDLQLGKWDKLTSNTDLPSTPVYSSDGSEIYFIAEHGDQIEVKRQKIDGREIENISNSLGYVKQLIVTKENRLWLSEYTGQGEIITRLKAPNEVESTYLAIDSDVQQNTTITIQSDFNPDAHIAIKPYSPWSSLRPRGWAPILAKQNDLSEIGLVVNGADILGFHRWFLAPVQYQFEDLTRFGGGVSYDFNNRIALNATRELRVVYLADDDDIPEFHEIKTNVQTLLHRPISKLAWAADVFAGIAWERQKQFSYGSDAEGTFQDVMAGVGFSYNTFQQYNHAITQGNGIGINAVVESFVDLSGESMHKGSAAIIQSRGNWRVGNNQTIITNFDFGTSEDDGSEFSLGGSIESSNSFGGLTRLGKRDFTLRGYLANEQLTGKNFVRASLAAHFPIKTYYNGLNTIPLGLGRVQGNVFTEAGDAWNDKDDQKIVASIGAEIRIEVLIGYDTLAVPLSFGFAHGLDESLGKDRGYIRVELTF